MPKLTGRDEEGGSMYLAPASVRGGDLIKALGKLYGIDAGEAHSVERSYYDTFDYRLYKNGLCFSKEEGSYCLYRLGSSSPELKIPCCSKAAPRFCSDLPDGDLKDALAPCIDVRALLPVVSVSEAVVTHRLMNGDKKTVLFLEIRRAELNGLGTGDNTGSVVITLKPVRGYENEISRAHLEIGGMGLEAVDGKSVLDIALRKAGKSPYDYSSKLDITLEPPMTAGEAFRVIMTYLFGTMTKNERGIIEDIDIEFLHDYRVAVRRARSLLSLIKGVFRPEETERIKSGLRELGKRTNLLRDLDIYILRKDEYMDMVPGELRPGLTPLFEMLEKDRRDAHRELVLYLESEPYKEKISFLGKFLVERLTPGDTAVNGREDVKDVARESIWKRYRKVIKKGGSIDDSSPDPELHMLRIECKKLRYALEFFSSLFPEDEIELLIGHLKKLQDNLGDFNDLHVQQQRLKGFLGELQSQSTDHADTLLSVGGLISILFQRQNKVRARFAATFKSFRKKENRRMFRQLFHTPDKRQS